MHQFFCAPTKARGCRRLAGTVLFGLIFSLWLLSPGWAQKPTQAPAPPPAAPPQGQILTDITKTLRQQIQDLTDQLARLQSDLKKTQEASQPLGVAISTHKTALSLDKITIEQAKELQQYYAGLADQKGKALAALNLEMEKFAKIQAELTAATKKSAGELEVKPPAKTAAQRALAEQNQLYLKLAATAIQKLEEIQKTVTTHREVLTQEKGVLEEFSAALQKFAEEKFKQQLLERERPADILALLQEFIAQTLSLPQRAAAWARETMQSGVATRLLQTYRSQLFGLLFFVGILLYAMKLLHRATREFRRNLAARADSFSLKLTLALFTALAPNYYLLALITWLALSAWVMGVLGHPAAKIILGGLLTLTGIRLLKKLLRALFAPGQPDMGIISLDDATASYYCTYGFFISCFFLGGYYLLWAMGVGGFQGTGFNFGILIYLVTMIFGFVWLLRRPYLDNLLAGAGLSPDSRLARGLGLLRLLVILGFSVVIIIDLLGFQNLALYLAGSSLVTAVVIALAWLIRQMGQDLNDFLTSAHGFFSLKFGIKAETLQGFQSFFAQTLTILVSLLAGAAILLTWGVTLSDIRKILEVLSQGPSLGPVTLSPLALLLAGLSLWLASKLSRFTRLVLETGLFRRRQWDIGIQHTISRSVHYLLMILGILVALGFLGINFANLAIVAGGLGVGIGFGLQNIVNNFLSGLILLFERPIKVGDLLVIDGQWGTVKAIRVRSTVFETSERSVLIIPNSELVSNKILNWTFYGRGPNRICLKVGVSYDSDVHAVTKLIDQVCRANPRVLLDPQPQIFFNAFGDSALDFTIWVFVHSPNDRVAATHELNAAIFDALNEHGIEIPFPQRDLHIRSLAPAGQTILPAVKSMPD